MKKKVLALGMSLLVLCGTVSSAYAAVYVKDGSGYQTVTVKDIPAWGDVKYDTTYASKKVTTGYFATFKKTYGGAALGNFAELISSAKLPKSMNIGIPLNKVLLAEEIGCSKGTNYFTGVSSHILEPSNKCDVDLMFSADNLKG